MPVFIRLFWTLAIPFMLTSLGARLLLSEAFLAYEYNRPGFPSDFYGFTLEDRLAFGPYALRYLFNNEPIDYLADLRLPADKCWNAASGASDCPLFSARELQHMEDVKIVSGIAFAAAIALALLGGASVACASVSRTLIVAVAHGIKRGCALTMLAIGCLALLSLVAWDQAFDLFHRLFFADGTWRFPFSDSLIRLYPEQLFFDAAIAIAMFAFVCAALIRVIKSQLFGRDGIDSQQ